MASGLIKKLAVVGAGQMGGKLRRVFFKIQPLASV
jgi:3-hydroxyacyl-CoA dehydrogenase